MVKILLIVGRAELCDPGQLLCRNVRCFCQISLGKAGAIHVTCISLLMIGSGTGSGTSYVVPGSRYVLFHGF